MHWIVALAGTAELQKGKLIEPYMQKVREGQGGRRHAHLRREAIDHLQRLPARRWHEAFGGGSVTVKAKQAKTPRISAAAPPEQTLEIEQGYGLKAWVDDPYLMIEQSDHAGKADTICLSRSELRQLLGKYGEWAA
jgi:hypothetical protein